MRADLGGGIALRFIAAESMRTLKIRRHESLASSIESRRGSGREPWTYKKLKRIGNINLDGVSNAGDTPLSAVLGGQQPRTNGGTR